jgi:hypothetical protein
MEQLKALMVVIMVIINLNISKDEKCFAGLMVFDSVNKIEFSESEFTLKLDSENFVIFFENNNKLKKIRDMKNPIIEFCYHNKKYIAKSIFVSNSIPPHGADFMFPVNSSGYVYFNELNGIILSKI